MNFLYRFFLFTVLISGSCFAQKLVTNNQLLWQIFGNGLKKPSYIFGSYHTNDSRVFKLSDSTYTAFLQADALVLEADIYKLFLEYDMRLNEVSLKFDANGKPFTSSNRPSQTKYGNEDGRPQFLDLYFQQLASNMNKKFYALETIDKQMEVLDFVYQKTPAHKNLEQLKLVQDNLLFAYLRGDIEHVQNIIKNQMSNSSASYDRLIVKRNFDMAAGIDTLSRNQSLFIAVGAGHLAGNDGVLNLLKKRGFQIRQVAATYSNEKTEAEKKLMGFNQFKYKNEAFKFEAILGGKPIIDSNSNFFRIIYQEMGQGNSYVIEIEDLQGEDLKSYAADIINIPENASITELMHQGKFQAFEGVGFEFATGLCWKRVFIANNKLVKLICYGGNKFMNSNRPKLFFDKVNFF